MKIGGDQKSLKKIKEQIAQTDDLSTLNPNNDFSSYKLILETDDPRYAKVEAHNTVNPFHRVNAIKNILKHYQPKNILDLGCGLGYTTQELKNVFKNANVVGVDISKDAVEYCNSKYKQCNFYAKAIDPDIKGQKFHADLIFAFEFYPFTRTSSLQNHKKYLNHIAKDLPIGGKLVIFQKWNNPNSLSKNYSDISKSFKNLAFDLHTMPITKITHLVKNQSLAVAFSHIIRASFKFFTRRSLSEQKILIITKI